MKQRDDEINIHDETSWVIAYYPCAEDYNKADQEKLHRYFEIFPKGKVMRRFILKQSHEIVHPEEKSWQIQPEGRAMT